MVVKFLFKESLLVDPGPQDSQPCSEWFKTRNPIGLATTEKRFVTYAFLEGYTLCLPSIETNIMFILIFNIQHNNIG